MAGNPLRSDQGSKQLWSDYCDQQLGGVRDPIRHEAHPPPDRDKVTGHKAALVKQVKNLQRSDTESSLAWRDYCDQQLGGVRDPNRHEAGALQTFLNGVVKPLGPVISLWALLKDDTHNQEDTNTFNMLEMRTHKRLTDLHSPSDAVKQITSISSEPGVEIEVTIADV